jgi:hypothetical protein
MKQFGIIALTITLFVGLFKIGGAELTNNVTAFGVMVLLLSLFADLKSFNFWGLTGEKEAKELQKLAGKRGVSKGKVKRPKAADVTKAKRQTPVQSMDSDIGNFLTLAFDIERLLKIAGTLVVGDSEAKIEELCEAGLLTESGVKQVEAIRSLRDALIGERGDLIAPEAVNSGILVAAELHNELSQWLDGTV